MAAPLGSWITESEVPIWAKVSARWSALNRSMGKLIGDFPVVSELHKDE